MSTPDLKYHYASLKDVRIHYATLGKGEPVVLLHGWPETSYAWRRVMPLLADGYALIAPDLRGHGDSSRPAGGYDKKTMAADIWQLMHDHLGYDKFAVVGHDTGALVAFRLAADHPKEVTHLVLLDVPVIGERTAGIQELGPPGQPPSWHQLFHMVLDLPEALTSGNERIYLEFCLRSTTEQGGVFSEADISEYVRAYSQAGAMRAGFDSYRAYRQDIIDNHATLKTGFKLPMPTLGLGGGGSAGRGEWVVESLRRVAVDADGGAIPDCGHWIAEEKPHELADRLRVFFARKKAKSAA